MSRSLAVACIHRMFPKSWSEDVMTKFFLIRARALKRRTDRCIGAPHTDVRVVVMLVELCVANM